MSALNNPFVRKTALAVVLGVVLFLVIAWLPMDTTSIKSDALSRKSSQTHPSNSSPSFLEVAKLVGTDKVTTHRYHNMYEKYLSPLRDRHETIKFLEIGLGCGMEYGPGASYELWTRYFPKIDLYFVEYDAECLEKWRSKLYNVKIFTGDQADPEFLKRLMRETGGDFDVIVDDGGHTMNQQIVSLNHLFKIVKPGGVYILEDTQTSYSSDYGGGPRNVPDKTTLIGMVKEMVDDLDSNVKTTSMTSGPIVHQVSKYVQSIDAMEEVIAFNKRTLTQMSEQGYSIDDPEYLYRTS